MSSPEATAARIAANPGASVWLRPDWPAPPAVRALMSTRRGGVSAPPFDSLNLRQPQPGDRPSEVDQPSAVARNQQRLADALGAHPVWLRQVHGTRVMVLGPQDLLPDAPMHAADACVSRTPGLACTVQVADCLPVLLCSDDGQAVGAAHAGWRGLAGGVLAATVQALQALTALPAPRLLAWLGPCIGPQAFEVGAEVLQAFGVEPTCAQPPHAGAGAATAPAASVLTAAAAFRWQPRADGSARWRADLPALARLQLQAAGVGRIYGGSWCTVDHRQADGLSFFSFRRDGRTGRMAAAIAVDGGGAADGAGGAALT